MKTVSFLKGYTKDSDKFYPYYIINDVKHYISYQGEPVEFEKEEDVIEFINEN